MDGIDLKKSDLLEELASAVMNWNGRSRLRWKRRRNIEVLMFSLGICKHAEPLEDLKLDALHYCFRQAQEPKPAPFIRKIWVQEIWSWQQLLAVGAARDTRPDLPPPNPDAGKSAMEMQWRRVMLLPPGF